MLGRLAKLLFFILLLATLIGFVLPQSYSASHSVTINAEREEVAYWLEDLSRWPDWVAWQYFDPDMKITAAVQNKGIGDHQVWQSKLGDGELTLTSLGKNNLQYSAHYNQAYQALGEIRYLPVAGGTEIVWQTHGVINVPVIGGYLAYFATQMLDDLLRMSFNNLDTQIKLRRQETNKKAPVTPE